MKADHAVVSIVVAFFAGAIIFGLIDEKWKVQDVKGWIEPLVTLAAAFAGAWFAFLLQSRKDDQKIKAANIGAGNRAIFLLGRFANQLELIRRQIINPVRTKPTRMLEMKPTLFLDYAHMKLDADGLSFLLETSFANVLGEAIAQENQFHSAIGAINERSRLHREEAQPALEKSGLTLPGIYTRAQIDAALGHRLSATMEMITDDAIKAVDRAVVSCTTAATNMKNALSSLYPGSKVIGIQLAMEDGPPPVSTQANP